MQPSLRLARQLRLHKGSAQVALVLLLLLPLRRLEVEVSLLPSLRLARQLRLHKGSVEAAALAVEEVVLAVVVVALAVDGVGLAGVEDAVAVVRLVTVTAVTVTAGVCSVGPLSRASGLHLELPTNPLLQTKASIVRGHVVVVFTGATTSCV